MPANPLLKMTGVIPALVTAFDQNEEFDEVRMRACIRFLIDRKVDGLYITGSTGETFLMSQAERKHVLEVIVDEVSGAIPVIAHVGAIGTKLSIELAQHAQESGVDALSSVPPFYWKFTPDQIYNFYADLTASTDLPMIAYNLPLAGLMGFDLIERLAGINGVDGIKYTATSHAEIMWIKQEIGKDFVVYSGADEMALSGLSFGADGIIGSFYNFIPEVYQAMKKAIDAGDLKQAKQHQETANAIISFALKRNMLGFIKRGMAWQGADAGYCRKPFDDYINPAEEEALKAECRQFKIDHNIQGVAFLDAI